MGYGMVIDLARCQGCRACMEACKVENNTPEGNFWMYVFRFETGKFPKTEIDFLPRPCQHCDNAPCVKVCPVGARYKRGDGITLTDFDRCIGCRYCEVACPYGVNYFNWTKPEDEYYYRDWDDPGIQKETKGNVPPYANPDLSKTYGEEGRLVAGGGHFKGVMEKCTFCVQRLAKDQPPACVQTCPVQALIFGDIDDPDSRVSKYVEGKEHFHLLDEAGTKPRVTYVNGAPPEEATVQIEAIKGSVDRDGKVGTGA